MGYFSECFGESLQLNRTLYTWKPFLEDLESSRILVFSNSFFYFDSFSNCSFYVPLECFSRIALELQKYIVGDILPLPLPSPTFLGLGHYYDGGVPIFFSETYYSINWNISFNPRGVSFKARGVSLFISFNPRVSLFISLKPRSVSLIDNLS